MLLAAVVRNQGAQAYAQLMPQLLGNADGNTLQAELACMVLHFLSEDLMQFDATQGEIQLTQLTQVTQVTQLTQVIQLTLANLFCVGLDDICFVVRMNEMKLEALTTYHVISFTSVT